MMDTHFKTVIQISKSWSGSNFLIKLCGELYFFVIVILFQYTGPARQTLCERSLRRKSCHWFIDVHRTAASGLAYTKIKIDGHVNFISGLIKMLSKSNTTDTQLMHLKHTHLTKLRLYLQSIKILTGGAERCVGL